VVCKDHRADVFIHMEEVDPLIKARVALLAISKAKASNQSFVKAMQLMFDSDATCHNGLLKQW
jgi:hypothetical protein